MRSTATASSLRYTLHVPFSIIQGHVALHRQQAVLVVPIKQPPVVLEPAPDYWQALLWPPGAVEGTSGLEGALQLTGDASGLMGGALGECTALRLQLSVRGAAGGRHA